MSSTKSRRGASRIAPDIDRQIESWLACPAEPTLDANEYDNERRKEADKAEREDITPVAWTTRRRLNDSDPQTKQDGHIFGVKVDFLGFWDLMGSAYLETQARKRAGDMPDEYQEFSSTRGIHAVAAKLSSSLPPSVLPAGWTWERIFLGMEEGGASSLTENAKEKYPTSQLHLPSTNQPGSINLGQRLN